MHSATLLLALTGCFVVGTETWEQRLDGDADGVLDPAFAAPGEGDCDDLDPLVGRPTLLHADADGDGYGAADAGVLRCDLPAGWVVDATDCADNDADVHPDAVERCNGVDDDCDGLVDGNDVEDLDPTESRWYADADVDGYGSGEALIACTPASGFVLADGDCAPEDAAVHPDAVEICDTRDNDCDGLVDEADDVVGGTVWYRDDDGDGFGLVTVGVYACFQLAGYEPKPGDCDDAEPAAYPGATEVCDLVDNDCDGLIDDDDASVVGQRAWFVDTDRDGWGVGDALRNSCFGGDELASDAGDCAPNDATISPAAVEVWYDGVDQDCDGADDYDRDGDGHYPLADGGDDCDDQNPAVYTGAPEIWYDGVDEDCDGRDDFDRDRDGFLAPEGGGTDCDDTDPTLRFGAALVPSEVPSLALALSAACPGATIRVEPGTYATNTVLMRPVTLLGLGGAARTILEGSGAAAPVVRVGAQASGTVIEGFTITGGSATAGGGISALDGGGPTGTLELKHLVIDGNTATSGGGGAALEGWSNLHLEDVEFVANSAPDGGALRVRNTTFANLVGCDIHANASLWSAAGLSVTTSTVEVARSSFRDNTVTGFGRGGGIFASDSVVRLSEVSLVGNRSPFGGAVYAYGAGYLALDRVLVAGNLGQFSGVVAASGPTVSVRNALIAQNAPGGLYFTLSPSVDVRWSTVVGNTGGAALDINGSSGAIADSIVAYNEAPGGEAVFVDDTSGVVNFTRVAAFANTDASFNAAAGAPTWTDAPLFMAVDSASTWETWDLHLQAGSPYVGVAGDGTDLGAWGGGAAAWTP